MIFFSGTGKNVVETLGANENASSVFLCQRFGKLGSVGRYSRLSGERTSKGSLKPGRIK